MRGEWKAEDRAGWQGGDWIGGQRKGMVSLLKLVTYVHLCKEFIKLFLFLPLSLLLVLRRVFYYTVSLPEVMLY